MTLFEVVVRTAATLHPHGEPDNDVSTFSGVIRAEAEDAPGETRSRAGKVGFHTGSVCVVRTPRPAVLNIDWSAR